KETDMEVLTEAAKNAYTNEDNKKCDEQLKKTLAIKIFLANILKDCLEEFKDYDQYDIADKFIEGEPEISVEAVHENEKEIIKGMDREDTIVRYDILFYAFVPSLAGKVKLIINVEAQNDFAPKYPLLKRAVYYCSRLISDQYNKEFSNSEYGKIKKVVSIWICCDPPKNKQNTITRFSLKEQNIIGEAKYNFKDYDLLDIVMVCLGGRDSENYKNCLKLVEVITSSDLSAQERLDIMKNDFNIKITKNIEEEVTSMCNVSYGIERRGEIKGTEKTTISLLKNAMNNLHLTLEQAMKALGVPENDYSKYRNLIEG
ncbi:MAG: Rpn family recombination-promoting nuclease/putative transposase, partial [Eubacterium sp.]|nr:Rpn family recombination-promoting nuclease/putative transposase [Eubacterium sp.]